MYQDSLLLCCSHSGQGPVASGTARKGRGVLRSSVPQPLWLFLPSPPPSRRQCHLGRRRQWQQDVVRDSTSESSRFLCALWSLSQSGDLMSSQGEVHQNFYVFALEPPNLNIWILGALVPLGQPFFGTGMAHGPRPREEEAPCHRDSSACFSVLSPTQHLHPCARGAKAGSRWGRAVLREHAVIGSKA